MAITDKCPVTGKDKVTEARIVAVYNKTKAKRQLHDLDYFYCNDEYGDDGCGYWHTGKSMRKLTLRIRQTLGRQRRPGKKPTRR